MACLHVGTCMLVGSSHTCKYTVKLCVVINNKQQAGSVTCGSNCVVCTFTCGCEGELEGG